MGPLRRETRPKGLLEEDQDLEKGRILRSDRVLRDEGHPEEGITTSGCISWRETGL